MQFTNRYPWRILTCLAVLTACTLPAPPAEPARGIPASVLTPSTQPSSSQPTSVYRIDSEASTLHILVYRGGTLARLGHNHVISSRSVSGRIWRSTALENSGFAISIPVHALIVDDNAARAAEGEDFPLNVAEDAKQGTKANMLRDTLLDGAHYPDISLHAVSLQGDADAPRVIATLRIKDQTRNITVPVTLRLADGNLHAKGEFEIKQTDFGITPLSVALGALLVLDAIKIKFDLVAKPD